MSNQYLRAGEIASLLGVNVSTIWRWSNDDRKLAQGFPRPIKISESLTAFSKQELDQFLQSRMPKPSPNAEKIKRAKNHHS